jgi:hypothetical protein
MLALCDLKGLSQRMMLLDGHLQLLQAALLSPLRITGIRVNVLAVDLSLSGCNFFNIQIDFLDIRSL